MYFSAVFLYVTTYTVLHFIVPPYRAVALSAVLLIELLLRAPLKYGAANACNLAVERGESGLSSITYHDFQKAVLLQLWLWKTRLVRYIPAFLPAVCLAVLSDRMHRVVVANYNIQVFSAVITVLSHACLVVGLFIVEFSMLRYASAWYLLPRFSRIKETIRCSKKMTSYRTDEFAEVCLHTLPFTFSTARATWVSRQLKYSKHAYNSFKNTKTVNGTIDA